MTVRVADEHDAYAIALVQVRSWQAIYRGTFPQDFLDGLDVVQRAEACWQHLSRSSREREAVLVAEIDDALVCFANVGPSRDEDAGDLGEVRAIYLLPERWRRGIGRALIAAGEQALVDAGFEEATLWV